MNQTELTNARKSFLEDTIKFYSEDTSRRAVREKGSVPKCVYRLNQEGLIKKCAIGRHIRDEDYNPEIESPSGILTNLLAQEVLPIRVSQLGLEFLQNIQRLHDEDENWNESGISELGHQTVKEIKDWFNLN